MGCLYNVTMKLQIISSLGLAALLLAGCASTPEPAGPPRFAPVITDQRKAPSIAEQVRENGNVRYFVSEEFFGPSLIDLFHREMALHAPSLPDRKRVDVTEIEVSILVSGNSYLIDPTHTMLGRERAAIAPRIVVLDETDADEQQVVQVRIGYQIDGQKSTESLEATVHGPEQARRRAGELYRAAIGRVIERLQKNG